MNGVNPSLNMKSSNILRWAKTYKDTGFIGTKPKGRKICEASEREVAGSLICATEVNVKLPTGEKQRAIKIISSAMYDYNTIRLGLEAMKKKDPWCRYL